MANIEEKDKTREGYATVIRSHYMVTRT